ncbi:auxilin-like protein 1 [Durio zibethinus]|uniref:Auxilin-like protein 1 n=1 Tax=Durio zibethinus TaxID=66656 RepID=A0A6P5ZEZ3_DURZI|nr:auxilin-like protein 1 [Durio zibethinus]
MENLSHSRKPNRGSSQATLTKRTTTCNVATNFSGKAMYDEVFGGPPRSGAGGPTLSPRPEDYTEIFGGFHASRGASIPVLDLPLVDDNDEVMFDVRDLRFNYAEIFGGFDGLDFAASYEELMRQVNGGDDHDRDGDSSDEAWMQAETKSLSEGSEHSGKYQCFLDGDYYEPIDSSMEFNISYHKANLRSNRDMPNGVTHVAELHADPEYAYIIETPLQQTDNKNPPLHVSVIDDIDLEFTRGVTKKKHLRKAVSHPSNWTAGEQTFTNNSTQREYRRNGSCSNEMFVTISEINLRTMPSDVPPPTRPPPLVDGKNGAYQNGQHAASGGRVGDSSPPFLDVEIDASSAAAASAAAMKEAMDKAQAKLKSAKELLERKREGIKNSIKPDSKSDGKGKKERASKGVAGSSDIKDERVQGMYGKEDSGMKRSVREDRQKAVKSQAPDSLEGEKLFNVPKTFVAEKHGKESQSVQEFDEIDGGGEWQEATQFFELVRTEKSRTGLEQTNNEKVLVQSMKSHELQHKAKKANIGALEQEQQPDGDKKVEAVREDHELEKVERDMKTAKESCERGESSRISKPVKEACRHKGLQKKVRAVQEVSELEEHGQSLTGRKHLENGKKPTGADELGKREKQVSAQQKENKVEVGQAMEQKGNGQQEKETSKSIESPKRVKEFQEREDEEKSWREVFEPEKNETKLEQVHVQIENEKRLREALELEEKEKRLKEACEREENEKKEKEARELEESEKIWKMALEQIENEKSLKQERLQEENERRQRKAPEQEEMEKKQREAHDKDESKRRPKQVTEEGKDVRQQKEAIEIKETEIRLSEVCEKEALNKGLKEACEEEETAKRLEEALEKENIKKMLEEAVEQKNYSKPEKEVQDTEDEVKQKVVELEETEELQGVNYVYQHTERGENGKELKIAEGTCQHMEGENPVVSDEVNKLDYSQKGQENQLVGNNDQNYDDVEETEESILQENGKMEAEFRDNEKKSVVMGKGDVDGKLNASGMAPCGLETKVNQFRKDDISVLCHQDDGVKKTGEAGIGIGQRNAEKINSLPGMDCDNDNQGLKFANEWRERARTIEETQVPSHLEENKGKFVSAQVVKESVETARKPEAAKASVLEGKESIQGIVQQFKISQSTERKDENINGSLTPEEKEVERLKRERELEKERLRKIEEEREREREREKDRMAVDRAALEARERGYAEARERAERAAVERATAEARQRAMAEARDRLEKACAEAREKSSMEARLRAERAAVERATAEARERAVEKAMAERAAFEARERAERSMSDKFSTSRNNGMQMSSSSSDLQDQLCQSTSSFGGLRYPYASAYNGVGGESAQRCKARLERYRRTAERAAKALEEKNMRDLLAQREQAERNRLAETLDADVKRWSSGKEGNLRALLSTLQYILGPESGWQPIPLTEVITSAAVKKAYRKATLCVHPDKLQQRGASIQQKYICEKVFDLLKEAWNKFNSEER